MRFQGDFRGLCSVEASWCDRPISVFIVQVGENRVQCGGQRTSLLNSCVIEWTAGDPVMRTGCLWCEAWQAVQNISSPRGSQQRNDNHLDRQSQISLQQGWLWRLWSVLGRWLGWVRCWNCLLGHLLTHSLSTRPRILSEPVAFWGLIQASVLWVNIWNQLVRWCDWTSSRLCWLI